nr:ATP-grasp domain-containing protein [Hyphomicrobium methylovorum]
MIAAFSGRALAQSARRAGYAPLVCDAFGDLDTRDAALAVRVIDGAMATGFRTKPLISALEDLAKAAPAPPIGLVLGSGFEDKLRLIEALAKRFRLLGTSAATYKACKNPATFFATLDALEIPHPQTQIEAPRDTTGWLSKRIGGSGGRHIRECSDHPRTMPRRYFQKRLDGDRLSVGGVFPAETGDLTVTRQWISPSSAQPFRFGGAVTIPVHNLRRAALCDAAVRVADAMKLTGMASFDFIVSNGIPHLLEVNPRPGASLDVLDDARGSQFQAHIAACFGNPPPVATRSRPQAARAMAILHADRRSVALGDMHWPDWSADRGPPGTEIPLGAPLASVLAEAENADAAEALARSRLAELEDLIYEHALP